MELEGIVFKILPAASGTSARGDWQRQDVIFDVADGQYTRKVVVTFFNKPQEIENLREGMECTVSINIESREYNGRWYTNVNGWRVVAKQAAAPEAAAPMPYDMPPMPQSTPAAPSFSAAEESDDLPF